MKDVPAELRRFLQSLLEIRRRMLTIPTGYHYHGSEDYILDRGQDFKSQPLTDLEHTQLFDAIDNWGRRFPLGQCFYNCQLLLFYDQVEALTYYEGFACGPAGMPVLHAWLSIGSHKVVDLTWRTEKPNHKGRLGNRIIGEIPEGWAYCGAEIPRRTVIDRLLDTEMSASHLEDWKAGYPLFKEKRVHSVEELLESVE